MTVRLVKSAYFVFAIAWGAEAQGQPVNLSQEQVRASCAALNSMSCEKQVVNWISQSKRTGTTAEQQDVQLGLLVAALIRDFVAASGPRSRQHGPYPCSLPVMSAVSDSLNDQSRRREFLSAAHGAACNELSPPRPIKIPRLSPS
jgi:hypothetical protein